jgi:hypothetical protein
MVVAAGVGARRNMRKSGVFPQFSSSVAGGVGLAFHRARSAGSASLRRPIDAS